MRRLLGLLLSAPAAPADVFLEGPEPASLYYEDEVHAHRAACRERFPSSSDRWQASFFAWNDAHATQLAQLRGLQKAVEAHLLGDRAGHVYDHTASNGMASRATLAIYGARWGAVLNPTQELARSTDAAALSYCKDKLAEIENPKLVAERFARARAAAQAALAARVTPR